jgi:hypothetical protein
MNKIAVAIELVKIAKLLSAFEFSTDEALHKYLDEHPEADKSNHRVKKKKNENESSFENRFKHILDKLK